MATTLGEEKWNEYYNTLGAELSGANVQTGSSPLGTMAAAEPMVTINREIGTSPGTEAVSKMVGWGSNAFYGLTGNDASTPSFGQGGGNNNNNNNNNNNDKTTINEESLFFPRAVNSLKDTFVSVWREHLRFAVLCSLVVFVTLAILQPPLIRDIKGKRNWRMILIYTLFSFLLTILLPSFLGLSGTITSSVIDFFS